MKIANVKAMVAKLFTVGLVAGAIAVAAPAKAQAQVSFGVHVGAAPYYPPVYGRPVPPAYPIYGGYYGPHPGFRYDEYLRHREFERQQFERRQFDRHQFERREFYPR